MYPLLLNEICKRAIWGGDKIKERFNPKDCEDAAELWLLSALSEGENTVKNGELKGLTLGEVFEKFGKAMGGNKYSPEERFPLFIKICDAKDSLPLTVSDSERIIYILDTQEDAQILLGFCSDTNEGEIMRRINGNAVFSACNFLPVHKGDIIKVPKGTFFAVGKGILFLQTEHANSSVYTVSDYGRTDEKGKKTLLKINEALKITDYAKFSKSAARLDDTFLYPFGTVSEFPTDKSVRISLIRLAGSVGITEKESFISVIVLNGEVAMSYPSGSLTMKAGDSIVLPAGIKAKFTGYAELLCSRL